MAYAFDLTQQVSGHAGNNLKHKNCRIQARRVDRDDHIAQLELTITEVSKAGRLSQKSFSFTLTSEQADCLASAIAQPIEPAMHIGLLTS